MECEDEGVSIETEEETATVCVLAARLVHALFVTVVVNDAEEEVALEIEGTIEVGGGTTSLGMVIDAGEEHC